MGALSFKSTIEGDELAHMLSRMLDGDADAVRDAVERIERLEWDFDSLCGGFSCGECVATPEDMGFDGFSERVVITRQSEHRPLLWNDFHFAS